MLHAGGEASSMSWEWNTKSMALSFPSTKKAKICGMIIIVYTMQLLAADVKSIAT